MNISNRLSRGQRLDLRLSLGTFLFLLAVFVYATPYNFSNSVEWGSEKTLNSVDVAEAIENGSISRPVGLIIFAGCGIFIFLRRRRIRFRINGLLGWLILSYVAWTIMSIAWADDSLLTLRRVGIFALFSLGILSFAQVLSIRNTITLTFLTCAATLLTAIVAELFHGTLDPFNSSWRLSGIMDPVALGWDCSLLAFAAFSLSRDSRRSYVFYSLSAMALLFLLLTKSRTTLLTTILIITIWWFFSSYRSYGIKFVLVSIVLTCLVCLLINDQIGMFGRNVITFGRGEEAIESESTMTGRIPLWNECLRYAVEHPIGGYGYNAFLTPHRIKAISNRIGWVPTSCHSGYVETLMGLGLIGLGILVLMLMLALRRASVLARRKREYTFVVAILTWLFLNLFTETNIITSFIFPTFLCGILLVNLGFIETVKIEFQTTGSEGIRLVSISSDSQDLRNKEKTKIEDNETRGLS